MNAVRRLACLALGLAAFALAPDASARIWPAWSLTGNYSVDVRPPFASMAGEFNFPLGDGMVTLPLHYDAKARLSGLGTATTTLVPFVGTYSVDTQGVQTVVLSEDMPNPGFTFTGTVRPDDVYVDGTFVKHDGFAAIPGETSGSVTIQRARVDDAQFAFVLKMPSVMDVKGRVRGAPDGRVEKRASMQLYGEQFVNGQFVPVALDGGRIRGKVKTDAAGFTTGVVAIVGKKWKVALAGPIDAAGFHATCDFTGAGFVLKGVAVTLPVQPGPTPPPGPPPPPPKNLLTGATASVVNGAVTISHSAVPSKFFGATAGLTIQFPATDGQGVGGGTHAIVHADPSTASTPAPDARRCIVTVSGKTFATALAPADVKFEISKYASTQGGAIELLATGTVVATGGAKRTVNVLVQATVQ